MRDDQYSLAELIDVARLQRLCDGLSAASGTVLAVLDPDGTILVASGWQDICTRFHRRNETSVAGCLESDRRVNQRLVEGLEAPQHIAYKCANGLWDVAFPLIIDGRHVATVFTGQFFYDDETIDIDAFRARAAELGFDEHGYLEALKCVPVLSHDQVEQTIDFLADLVGMLGELGLSALRRESGPRGAHRRARTSSAASRRTCRCWCAPHWPTARSPTSTSWPRPWRGRTAAELVGQSVMA